MKKVVFWCFCLLFLISCHEDDEQGSLLRIQTTLSETKWVLQYLESDAGSRQIPPEEFKESLYIYFDSDTTFSAGSPCNAGFGRYEADQSDNFQVKEVGSTYKLCADANMDWEGNFFGAIRETEKYMIKGNILMLLGKSRMVFQQGIPPEKSDCFDFGRVDIDRNLCISDRCKITKIVNGEDTTFFSYENHLLKNYSLQYSHPALTDREVEFIYDVEDRLIKVEAVNPVTRQHYLMKELVWSSDGLLEAVITYQGNRIRQTFTYDAESRMIKYVHREQGDELVFSKEYLYDERGNPVEEKTFNEQGAGAVIRRFEYDNKTNPFKGLGYPTVYEVEPEVLSYFSANNIVKITEEFPGRNEATMRRYVYAYNDVCVPVEVQASFDLCSVIGVQYVYDCKL